jgi:hypothetical protein
MLPVAALLGGCSRFGRVMNVMAVGLTLAGAVAMFSFQGLGARIPQDVLDPLKDVVWPHWSGRPGLPEWWSNERFCRNLVSIASRGSITRLPSQWQALQFLPLALAQGVAIILLYKSIDGRQLEKTTRVPRLECRDGAAESLDLSIDQEQHRRGGHEEAQDPQAQAKRV